MSWLFSQALVEASSVGISLDGAQCALWNGTPTQRASWLPDKTTDAYRLSRSGMTFKPLTADHGEALLTSFPVDFHVRTSQSLEKEKELMASAAECGSTWRESLAKWDRDSSSWKTPHCLLLGDSEPFSGTWPKWGMMQDGECWEQDTPELVINGIEFGYWATPAARDYKDTPGMSKTREKGRSRVDQTARQVYASMDGSGLFTPPTAKETWMDVTEHSTARNAEASMQNADALGQQWMTSMITKSEVESNTPKEERGGLLNSEWSEWLMGWPIGWTDLKPLVTGRFRQWRDSHGKH